MRILLVEDDIATATAIESSIKNRVMVDVAHTYQAGQELAENNLYDVIVLDLNLPDGNGLSLCKHLRSMTITTPILILTAEQKVAHKVKALDNGADDYLTKPFSLAEFQARIRALSRRNTGHFAPASLTVGDVVLDANTNSVTYQGQLIVLRRKEYLVLEYLMRSAGQIVTREMLFEHVWGGSSESLPTTVDVHIKHLRDKLDKPFKTHLIRTVHGMGYRLAVETTHSYPPNKPFKAKRTLPSSKKVIKRAKP